MSGRMSLIGLGPAAREVFEKEGVPDMFKEFVSVHGLRQAQYISTRAPWFKSPVSFGTAPQHRIEQLIFIICNEIGPLVDKGTNDNIYVAWDSLGQLSETQASALAAIGNEFGRTGMTIRLVPKPHSVGLSFTTDFHGDEWKAMAPRVLWKGLLLGQKIHHIALSAAGKNLKRIVLSENQTACLSLLADGFSIQAISEAFDMSEQKVMRNLDNARKKLEAHNHAHAVARAITLGIIAA